MTGTTPTIDKDDVISFSAQLRGGTTTEHNNAEHSKTMTDLMAGDLSLEQFIAMQVQHGFVYEALENALDAVAHDPIVAPFVDERLRRTPSMRSDLLSLDAASKVQLSPTAATQAYVEHLTDLAQTWPLGVIAHHYTRYLGDLSGGQFICRVVERTYGIDASSGTSFFHFTEIESIPGFKEEYRSKLDALPLGIEDRDRFINEVMKAYEMSTDLFFSLDNL